MIELIVKKPRKPIQKVQYSWGTSLHRDGDANQVRMTRHDTTTWREREGAKPRVSRSYELQAYFPDNVVLLEEVLGD